MPLSVKNIEYFRSLTDLSKAPEFGMKLAEALQSIANAHNTVEQQTNSNSTGEPPAPPSISGLSVTASNGHFQVAINHQGSEFYRDVHYFVEHSASPNFTDSHTVPLGPSRNANLFLGNTTRYFRAYASYGSSGPGAAVYHGGKAQPQPVSGGGTIPGPSFAPSAGSGTGAPGVGHQGPGTIPFRTKTGKPPVR